MAPFIPFAPSVSISSAPKAFIKSLLSTLAVSGIIMMTLYPLSFPINDNAIPVFPEVGSTIVPPGCNFPSFSAASIIPRAARSFTLPPRLYFSSFTYTSAMFSSFSRLSFTTGVFPINSKMFS